MTGHHDTPNGRSPQLGRHLTFRCWRGIEGDLSQYANGFHLDKIFAGTELFSKLHVPFTFVLTNA